MTEKSIRKIRNKRIMINDKMINRKNKKLMIDKILSYSPSLFEGVKKYNNANINFTIFILLSALMVTVPVLSFPCCLISIAYLIKMFQLIKFRNIKNIVNILGKDLAFKGIYDKGKTEELLCDFVYKFGDDIIEYKLLSEMIDKYETFVTKIEWVISNIYVQNKEEVNEIETNDVQLQKIKKSSNKEVLKKKVKDYCRDLNDKLSLTYKNEAGEIKKINKAIEFFDEQNKNGDDSNIGVLKSNKRENSKLTVYLYKKSSNLPNNAI